MTHIEGSPVTTRIAAVMLLCISFTALSGCSQDFASVDDVYVPRSGQDRFPIQVVDMPVKMSISASSGKLPAEDVNRLSGFANAAREDRTTPVSVSYPSGSKRARDVSQQAVKVLMHQGVPRSMIHTSSYKGKSDVVSLSFTRRVAATKPCGDWSKNVAENSANEPYPNFGCTLQNNFAAMAANPEDFERPRTMGPAPAAGRMPGIGAYTSGEWMEPPSDETFSLDSLLGGG
jgi:pilus assembly protein CpaD